MIYDRLCNIQNYLGIHENLDLALNYIHDHLEDMPREIQLKGMDVRAFFNEYETVGEEEAFFEAHRAFADIQIVRSGRERVAVSNIDSLELEQDKPEKDFAAYQGPEELSVLLEAGSFIVFFPGEGHKLKMHLGTPEAVTKTVFKVRIK